MLGFFHSLFARRNMRRQVEGWINEIEKGISSREKELRKFRKLAPLTPSDWDDKMIPILESELDEHRKRLKEYLELKREYEKEGLI